jgi:hypothetical protein
MTISSVTIAFASANLFTSTVVTGSAAGVTQTSEFTPAFTTKSIEYKMTPPLMVPTAGSATFSLSMTITTDPQATARRAGAVYAGLFDLGTGGGSPGLGAMTGALLLLSVCTGLISGSRRRTTAALIILMLVAASQVGCDSGSVPASNTVYYSNQTATAIAAAGPKGAVGIGGLPAFLSHFTIKQ